MNFIIVFGVFFLLATQAVKTSDPFYVIAHMANTQTAVDWALSQGANGIASDLQFDFDGNPTIVEHGDVCDCACAVLPDHICKAVLNYKCAGRDASANAAAHMQYVANRSAISLYYIDSKVKAEWGSRLDKAGAAIIPFLDKNLFGYGYQGKVLISAPKINVYNYIQTAVNASQSSVNKDRYFFTFDEEEDDYKDVIAMLSRLTNKRVYATGSSGCSPITYDSALKTGVAGKNRGENGLTIAWTIDREHNMDELINFGVQGIITNRVGVLRQRVNSMNLNLASSSSPIPTSSVNVSSPYKCSCEYHNGGCLVSFPSPGGKACKCQKIFWGCVGSVVSCDTAQQKCANPDESKEACQLGRGNCGRLLNTIVS